MKVLLVYCHPREDSFNAAVRDTAVKALQAVGHEVRLADLYAEGFDPVLSAEERLVYETEGENEVAVADEIARLLWAEALVFVYPTWWFGLPAMLKGWLDRVLVPHATFTMPPESRRLRPRLTHIRSIASVTTGGAPWWLTRLSGQPGRRTLLRVVRWLCNRNCRTMHLAMYKMDTASEGARRAFLARVDRRLRRL